MSDNFKIEIKTRYDVEVAKLRKDGWKSDEPEDSTKFGWWHPRMCGCVFSFSQAVIINNWRREGLK